MIGDKPFFSRKQLSSIIWVCAIAIVLLSASGRRQPPPEATASALAGIPVYWLDGAEDVYRLHLNYATASTDRLHLDTLLDAQQQRWQQHVILTQTLRLQRHPDRIELILHSTNPEQLTSALRTLLDSLHQPLPNDLWQRAEQRQRATRYLQQNQQPAVTQMRRWLTVIDSEQDSAQDSQDLLSAARRLRQQLFSPASLSLALLSPDPHATLQELRSTLLSTQKPPWQPSTPPAQAPLLAAKHQQITRASLPPLLLLGRTTRGRQDGEFSQWVLTLALLERLLQDMPGAGLQWTPYSDWGILRLYWSDKTLADSEPLLSALRQQVAALSVDAITAQREAILEKLEDNLHGSNWLAGQLSIMAFYRLPPDYLARFSATIAASDPQQIRARLLQLLDHSAYARIAQAPVSS